jgi:hypothetical protein
VPEDDRRRELGRQGAQRRQEIAPRIRLARVAGGRGTAEAADDLGRGPQLGGAAV